MVVYKSLKKKSIRGFLSLRSHAQPCNELTIVAAVLLMRINRTATEKHFMIIPRVYLSKTI